jgi:hypothetical protein
MQMPGLHNEAIHNPRRYLYAQIDRACAIAQRLGRGKLVLVDRPSDERSRPVARRAARPDGVVGYAFALWHGCSIGDDPQHRAVRERAAHLRARIAEHTPSPSES